ncbi:MAG: hypothetical protein WBP29_01835 [Candidatus Zixiibacteriota bacterium]
MLRVFEGHKKPIAILIIEILIFPIGCSTSKVLVIERPGTLFANDGDRSVAVERVYFKNGVSAPVSNCRIEDGELKCQTTADSLLITNIPLDEIDSLRSAAGIYQRIWAPSMSKLEMIFTRDQAFGGVESPIVHEGAMSFSGRAEDYNVNVAAQAGLQRQESLPLSAIDSIKVSVKELDRERTIGVVAFCASFAVGFLLYWAVHTSNGFD